VLAPFCSLLPPLYYVLVRPQNIELGPVISCDSSSVIPYPRQAGLHFFFNFNHALSVHHSLGNSVCSFHNLHEPRLYRLPSRWILRLTLRGKRLLRTIYLFWTHSRHHLDTAAPDLLTILLTRLQLLRAR
jgi:hypothetical protein